MKINKSKLAEELGVDRRSIDKYLNGFMPKRKREKPSKIDEYYETIHSTSLRGLYASVLVPEGTMAIFKR
ncbi:putative regulator of amino acid metabolism with ACT domain [Neobacillus niacini]|nr:putative regulator of amino acid metabolism with ACT domain [Neobacillus niacini]